MSRFQIETYDHRHLEPMTALYNAETAFEPHIGPLTPERFVELVERKSYFDPSGLLVAVQRGRVVGWVHACVAAGTEPRHDPGKLVPRIRMLIYPRDRLRVGKQLVAQATEWLRRSGQTALYAMHCDHGYPFYRGFWMGGEPLCPAGLAHVQLAFEVGGYKYTYASIFMAMRMDAPPGPARPGAKLEFAESLQEMKHEPMHESWIGFEPRVIQAISKGDEVGRIGWVVVPQVAERLGAPAMSIYSLGVGEAHRRKGVGAALVARAQAAAYRLGARFASVDTQLWNHAAQMTYAKRGYQPYCMVIGRTLTLPQEDDPGG
jgi:GNAT superfamily N-acetyltransferase